MERQRVVCILGMHRSGTSVVSRVLNLLGVHLGPNTHVMPAGPYNPRGQWEHYVISAMNDAILARFGGNWHEPPILSPGWEGAPELADLGERARTILHEDFGTAELWGWKDPRTCLTLPFWQRLLSGRPVQYVICFRNPVDVVGSLEARDGFSFEKGGRLWLMYVTAALRHTMGHPRLFVFYEDMMEDWRREVRRLAEFIGRSEPAGGGEIEGVINEFLEEDLHHYRSTLLDSVNERRLAFPAKALYVALRTHAAYQRHRPHDTNGEDSIPETVIDGLSDSALAAELDSRSRPVVGSSVLQERRKALHRWAKTIAFHLARRDFRGLMRAAEIKRASRR